MDLLTLSVSITSTISIITQYQLINCSYLVGLFCLFDLFYVKKLDMFIHHIFVLIMIYCFYNTLMNNNEKNIFINNILSTEISTNFLMIKSLLSKYKIKNKLLNIINNICFIITFFYYRIYNYFIYIVISKKIHLIIIKYYNNYQLFFIFFSIYGLFLLNLFWMNLIIKKIFKLTPHNVNCRQLIK